MIYFVERSGNMKAKGIARIVKLFAGTHIFPGSPFFIGKGVFHLVSVVPYIFRTKNRRNLRQFDFCNTLESIGNLLLLETIADRFPEITSLLYVVNLKLNDTISDQEIHSFRGPEYIEEEMEGLKFRVNAKSFYQTNSAQAYELYKVARKFAGLDSNNNEETKPLVYDLYTGTGTIANFVARAARQVIGIEYVEEAIEDARLNASVNGLDNTLFYAGDMKEILTDGFICSHGKPDVMIIDPPRAGMHEDVIKVILKARPSVIVYVSCNPATQARDLSLLDCAYRVTDVQPVDMFPHTHHVENVVRLQLK